MKQTIKRLFVYFIGFFILIIIFGAIFKPSDLNVEGIVRAIMISLGTSFGIAWGGYFMDKKMAEK